MPPQTFTQFIAGRANLVAYWRLGEGSGTTATDDGGSNDGTYTGGVTLGQTSSITGDTNAAILLDGSTGYIVIPDAAALDLGDGPWTRIYRFKRTRTSHSDYEILESKGSQSLVVAFWPDNTIGIHRHSGGTLCYTTTTVAETTNWHTLILTKNGATFTLELDGVDRKGTYTDRTFANTADPLHLGAESPTAATFLGARLDEVVIFSAVLSAAERQDVHNLAHLGPLTSGTLSAGTPTASSVDLSWSVASAGTGPYTYQVQRAPDVAGSPGTWANVGSAQSATTYTDSGLSGSTTYHYRVRSTDSEATPQTIDSNVVMVTTSAGADTTPPTLTITDVVGITEDSATITDTTDEAAEVYYEFGTTTAYGANTGWVGSGTSHSTPLSGLLASTTYHYRGRARDAAGNVSSYSADGTFTTEAAASIAEPAVVTDGPRVTAMTATTATISWTTDQAAYSQVEHGSVHPVLDGAYASVAPAELPTTAVTSHEVTIALVPGQLTYYRVISLLPEAAGGFETVTPGDTPLSTDVVPLVELAFTTTPTAAPVWEDVTAFVRGLQWRRGRTRPLERNATGTLFVTLTNESRVFDPAWTAGPWYGHLKATKRIRVRTFRPLTTGPAIDPQMAAYLNRWPQQRANYGSQWVDLQASDGFEVLARATVSATRPQERSDQRIDAVLDSIQWLTGGGWVLGSAAESLLGSTTRLGPVGDRVLDVGAAEVAAATLDTVAALAHLQAVDETEDGRLFLSRDGALTFHSRARRLRHPYLSPEAVFGDDQSAGSTELPYVDLTLSASDDADLYNVVQITRTGGTAQTAEDTASQADHFPITLSRTSLAPTDNAALQQATHLVHRYAGDRLHITSLVLNPHVESDYGAALWTQFCRRELGDYVTVRATPLDSQSSGERFTQESVLEGIDVTWTHGPEGARWAASWALSAAETTRFWVLGRSALGAQTTLAY